MNTSSKYIIYEIENQINGKKYVGQTTQGFDNRKAKHYSALNRNTHPNKHLQNSWNKYGEQNFTFNILEECDYEDLDFYEINYIWMWNLMNPHFGYNHESGGNLNKTFSEESKQKMSEAHKGKAHLEETKKKISNGVKDAWSNPNSKYYSVETKKRKSENNACYWKGKTHSEETKKKMSKSHTGKVLSNKTKIKLSKIRNKTGIFHVYKSKNSQCKQGFLWRYRYKEDNKEKDITSVCLTKLEQKVKSKGLPWIIIDDEKALKSFLQQSEE